MNLGFQWRNAKRARLGDALVQCYCAATTREQIDSVLERVRSWPQEDQEELAELVREIEARRTGLHVLNDEERKAIAEARREPFVSEDDVQAFWKRHGIARGFGTGPRHSVISTRLAAMLKSEIR